MNKMIAASEATTLSFKQFEAANHAKRDNGLSSKQGRY